MPPPIDDRQLPLFARKALIEFPPTGLTADCMGEVEADDGARYHIKGDANGVPTRASEWIGTLLAEEVGIQAPAAMPIELINGSQVFGSRRISGAADDTATTTFLLAPASSNQLAPVRGLGPILSAIYALDMFIFNVDRHIGNYLSVDDNGVRRLFAFDFSRSMFCTWPWQGVPPPNCNTRRTAALLRQLHGFDPAVASVTLDRLGSLSPTTMEGFIKRMPADWLPRELLNEFMAWWSGRSRPDRLEALRKGFGDGTVL